MTAYECPVCHSPLMSANETCGGSFTENDHPSAVKAVPSGTTQKPDAAKAQRDAGEWGEIKTIRSGGETRVKCVTNGCPCPCHWNEPQKPDEVCQRCENAGTACRACGAPDEGNLADRLHDEYLDPRLSAPDEGSEGWPVVVLSRRDQRSDPENYEVWHRGFGPDADVEHQIYYPASHPAVLSLGNSALLVHWVADLERRGIHCPLGTEFPDRLGEFVTKTGEEYAAKGADSVH